MIRVSRPREYTDGRVSAVTAINIGPPRWYNLIGGHRLSRKRLSLSPPLEVVTFTNEASARTGSCVYAIGEERKREREERKGKRRGRENRVSGSVKANKGDPPCCPFVNFCRSKQGRKEGWLFGRSKFPFLARMGWMTLRTISVPRREECIIPGMFEAIAKW